MRTIARERNAWATVVVSAFLVIFTAVVVYPFFLMLLMSVRKNAEIILNPLALPTSLQWQNFAQLFTDPRIRFHRYFVNSVVVTLTVLAIVLTLSALAGYGLGRKRYDFRGRALIFTLFLLSLMIPTQAVYIPQFRMMISYGLYNTRLSIILLYSALQLPMSIMLLRSYFQTIPAEMEESAVIDGASDRRILRSIMIPIARPAFVSVGLLSFIGSWNELLQALTLLSNAALWTLPLAMMNFIGERSASYGMAAASLVVGIAPVVALYLVSAERFIESITVGAVKG
jgi:raffinose/stachyose/melibiose transport system permease protein